MEKFVINIPQSALDDLRNRLANARYPADLANDDWTYGTNAAYLKNLCEYWRTEFDWRAQEQAINAFDHYRTDIEGTPIHFIHQKGIHSGKGPKPMPLILNHGWPWTFWDMKKVIGPLTDPAAHGGDPADAFDIVVPSLPGYGFSTPLRTTGLNFWRTADLWAELMRKLGYGKFSSYGGDWGSAITAQLGHKYADRLHGIYVSLPMPLDIFINPQAFPGEEAYAPAEKHWFQRNLQFFALESGYSALQATKPQTLAYGLNDSPVAQCAWILEKRRTWSDCGGDVERVFTRDELLTTMSLYWFTQSGGSSARYYYECIHNPWQASHDRQPVVQAPSGLAIFENEVAVLPKSWAEKYYNLQRYRQFPSGGHFAPMEQPDIIVNELREFFRPLR